MIKLYKFSYYTETKRCEAWLEEMASKGWFVEQFTRNLDFVRFRKDEPKTVHYYFYFNDQQKLDEESFIQTAKEQGWINLNKNPILAKVFLFVSTDLNPKPLETDLVEQENMYRNMTKKLSKFEFGMVIIAILLSTFSVHTFGWWILLYPSMWVVYTRILWTLEIVVIPKRYKRFTDTQRRILAMIFRVLRFSIIPILILLFILIQQNMLEMLPIYE